MTLEFSLTQEQEAIRDLAHEFAVNEIRPVAAHFDETEEFPYEVVKKAHKLGLSPAAFLPEEYGGQGLDFLTELMLNEELSWGCAGIAVCVQSMALAIAGIRSSGTEEQKKRWLPEFTNPDRLVLGGLGLTEPDSGSDALAMKTRAKRVSDGYLLNGRKVWVANAEAAQVVLDPAAEQFVRLESTMLDNGSLSLLLAGLAPVPESQTTAEVTEPTP